MQYHRHFYVLHKSTKLFILCREFLWLVYRVCTHWLLNHLVMSATYKMPLITFYIWTVEFIFGVAMYLRFWLSNAWTSVTSHSGFCAPQEFEMSTLQSAESSILVRISLSSQIQWLANIKHTVWSGSNTAISLYNHAYLEMMGPSLMLWHHWSRGTLLLSSNTNPSYACEWQNYI